jgi:hypothetical protein
MYVLLLDVPQSTIRSPEAYQEVLYYKITPTLNFLK